MTLPVSLYQSTEMAVSGVKARLMLFESAESANNNVTERKDSKGEPPALARFRLKQQQLQDSKEEEDRPKVAQKPEQINMRQTTKTEPESSDSVPAGSNGGGGGGKLNVAKVFAQGGAPPPLRPVVPLKKPGVSDTTAKVASPETERPKVALKPPAKALSPTSPVSPKPFTPTEKLPLSAPKPSSITANGGPATINHLSNTAPVKLPVMVGRPALKKTNSSLSSGSSSSSGSVKLSPSSHTENNTNGPIDFLSVLKPRPSLDGKAETSPVGIKGLSNMEAPQKPSSPKRPGTPESTSTDETVQRQSDGKRFKKVKLSSLPPDTSGAPEKPSLPDVGVDLTLICQQHANMLHSMANDELPPPPEDLVEEDIYDDGITPQVEIRQSPKKQTSVRKSNRISEIPTMTAEEEGFDEDFYGDGTSEDAGDLLYVDAASSDTKPASPAKPKSPDDADEEFEDVYMDEESVSQSTEEESEEAKKRRLKEEAEAKKKEQKRLKELEKKKKQEEKEEQKRRKKFNLTGDETNVGEGLIKEDAKGRGNNLGVKKGEKVTIIRLDNNPANKFLVKTETDMGYVDSSNIEIDADIIRKMMEKSKKDSVSNAGSTADDDQEIYDDVAESPPNNKVNAEQFEEEDIYQDVA